MELWLKTTFPPGPGGSVILYNTSTGAIAFDPTDSTGVFSTITQTPPTLALLSALPIAKKGWQPIFDAWKASGYIA